MRPNTYGQTTRRVLELADGTRTGPQIARIVGCHRVYVHKIVREARRAAPDQFALRCHSYRPHPSFLPLYLDPTTLAWLQSECPPGANLSDFARSIIIDAMNEDPS